MLELVQFIGIFRLLFIGFYYRTCFFDSMVYWMFWEHFKLLYIIRIIILHYIIWWDVMYWIVYLLYLIMIHCSLLSLLGYYIYWDYIEINIFWIIELFYDWLDGLGYFMDYSLLYYRILFYDMIGINYYCIIVL